MAVFRCKMCGGALEIQDTQSIATCEYCGTQQTLPRLVDDRKTNLYDRASHFRRNNDFDKAMAIYEQILNEDNTDAESYWSILLCRYGIEYVEDPTTRKRVPTVNRAQFTSIFDDENYKSAIRYADTYQRSIYESEATTINNIQKGILAISQKEKPFDVFICYKETDANGRRTQDSVLATELYQELVREGFKVFFSRITLEDKLGIAYEPYIFAALNSSKVMVVLGTRPEYFNAVWVKNEWSRYLALIKSGAKKMLIPAYRDMDPYNLPEEFSHLQAQDMSKLGFMQDLTRGIKKIIGSDAPKPVKETVVTTVNGVNVAPMLRRASMFIEDGHFDRADDLLEQVLNQDPENAYAYLYKMMITLDVRKQEDLANLSEPFDYDENYKKFIRFASGPIKDEVQGYVDRIKAAVEEKRKSELYEKCMEQLNYAQDEDDYIRLGKMFAEVDGYKDSVLLAQKYYNLGSQMKEKRLSGIYVEAVNILNSADATIEYPYRYAAGKFKELDDYRDSKILYQRCIEMAEIAKRNEKYIKLCKQMNDPNVYKISNNRGYRTVKMELKNLIIDFKELNGWSDSDAKIKYLYQKIEEVGKAEIDDDNRKKQALLQHEKDQKAKRWIVFCAIVTIACIIIICSVVSKQNKYETAVKLMKNGEYSDALDIFDKLYDYEKSEEYAIYCAFLSDRQGEIARTISRFSITTVMIPDGVTHIDEYAFAECTTLTSVVIPSSVTSIGQSAFLGCTSLESIELPINLTSIGSYAFKGCYNLSSINIPSKVTSIGNDAFTGCSFLEWINFDAPNGWYRVYNSYDWNNKTGGLSMDMNYYYVNAEYFTNSYRSYFWYKK